MKNRPQLVMMQVTEYFNLKHHRTNRNQCQWVKFGSVNNIELMDYKINDHNKLKFVVSFIFSALLIWCVHSFYPTFTLYCST